MALGYWWLLRAPSTSFHHHAYRLTVLLLSLSCLLETMIADCFFSHVCSRPLCLFFCFFPYSIPFLCYFINKSCVCRTVFDYICFFFLSLLNTWSYEISMHLGVYIIFCFLVGLCPCILQSTLTYFARHFNL